MNNQFHSDVILVDELDKELGIMEKMEAHRKGYLHRAFSIFVFNSNNELLIQQRAFGKYHSEGLWTNTCCSHPGPGESILEAAHRRLQEEMGFTCELRYTFHFIYHIELDNELIEHELDHVIIGFSDNSPVLNPEEAIAYKWIDLETLKKDLKTNPEEYTYWFKIIIQEHFDKLKQHLKHESL